MDEPTAEVLTPEKAAEILRALEPLQQQAVGLYVNHVLSEQSASFNEHLQQQLKAQEERLNAEFLAELTKRTTAAEDEIDDDLYTSRDAVTEQVLQQADRLDEHERHRALFAQQSDSPAAAQLSVADVEEIAERVAHTVFRRLATPPDRVQGQPYVGTTTLQPQLTTPSFRRPTAYVPTLPIRR